MPDREGKTLEMSPAALLGCAEAEVVARRFKAMGNEMLRSVVRVRSRSLGNLRIMMAICSGVRLGVVSQSGE